MNLLQLINTSLQQVQSKFTNVECNFFAYFFVNSNKALSIRYNSRYAIHPVNTHTSLVLVYSQMCTTITVLERFHHLKKKPHSH